MLNYIFLLHSSSCFLNISIFQNPLFLLYAAKPRLIDKITCKDEMPPNWMPKARYHLGVLCESITCNAADDDFCSRKFSEPPLSNCVNGTYGLVRDFCKHSCENCGTILIILQ